MTSLRLQGMICAFIWGIIGEILIYRMKEEA